MTYVVDAADDHRRRGVGATAPRRRRAHSAPSTTGGTCCPACTAVVGTSSFTSHFEKSGTKWAPAGTFSGCACLDFSADDYKEDGELYGEIELTAFDDCARITGSNNKVRSGDGNDALFAAGNDNTLAARPGAVAAGASRPTNTASSR